MTHDVDPLLEIYRLINQSRFSAALAKLMDPKTHRIKPPFRSDLNCAWYSVGDILFRQERYAEAARAFKSALNHRRDDADAMMALGNCYDCIGRPRLAERHFRRALLPTAYPLTSRNRREIAFNLANALFDQGRYGEAADIYKSLSSSRGKVGKVARTNLALARHYARTDPVPTL